MKPYWNNIHNTVHVVENNVDCVYVKFTVVEQMFKSEMSGREKKFTFSVQIRDMSYWDIHQGGAQAREQFTIPANTKPILKRIF